MTSTAGRRAHFLLPDGRRLAAVSGAEMREIDRIAMEETGPGLSQMMENAGRSMAVLAIRTLGPVFEHASVLVVAGPGGNGGGGICAARHLAPRVGRVVVCLTAPDRLTTMTRFQLEMFLLNGGELGPGAPAGEAAPYDLIVDAILGYGLGGPPRGPAAAMIRWMNDGTTPVLALDLPSGLGGEGGRPDADDVVRAECTLTLHMPKPGLEDPQAGRLFVADLAIPAGVTRRLGIDPPCYCPALHRAAPTGRFAVTPGRPARSPGSHACSARAAGTIRWSIRFGSSNRACRRPAPPPTRRWRESGTDRVTIVDGRGCRMEHGSITALGERCGACGRDES